MEDTAGQRQAHTEGQISFPCPLCPPFFPVRKFKAGILEKHSVEHGREGREAAQHKLGVKRFCVKVRHKTVRTVTPFR